MFWRKLILYFIDVCVVQSFLHDKKLLVEGNIEYIGIVTSYCSCLGFLSR